MQTIVFVLAFLAALGSGLMGGFFYAFSSLVMPALAKRPPIEAAGTMQIINVVVLNPQFFALFFGPAALGVAVSAFGPFALPVPQAALALCASAVYAFGCVGVTIAKNVPLNDELATVSLRTTAAETVWRHYLRDWTWWNHVRAVACLVACAGFILVIV